MSKDRKQRAQEELDKMSGVKRNSQGKPIMSGTGFLTRASRALNPNSELYSYPDLEEQEKQEMMNKLAEERMRQKANMPEAQPSRAPASVMDAAPQEPDEMRRAKLLMGYGLDAAAEEKLRREQPKTFDYYQKLKFGR